MEQVTPTYVCSVCGKENKDLGTFEGSCAYNAVLVWEKSIVRDAFGYVVDYEPVHFKQSFKAADPAPLEYSDVDCRKEI